MNVTAATGDYSIPYLVESSDSETEPQSLDEDSPSKSIKSSLLSKELQESSKLRNKQIQQYASSNNLVMVPFEELEKLKSIDDEKLLLTAQERGYHLLTAKEYEELIDEEEMKKRLESKGLVTIPFDELESIKTCLDKPDKAYITDKANLMGLIVTSNDLYDTLVKNANEPSVDHLTAKAKAQNLTLLSNEELEQLKNPSLEQLTKLASKHESRVVSNNEYESLIDPSVETITQKAKSHKMTIVSDAEYQNLYIHH